MCSTRIKVQYTASVIRLCVIDTGMKNPQIGHKENPESDPLLNQTGYIIDQELQMRGVIYI